MVSLQKDGFMLAAPLDQEIDGSTGLRPAIDVITERHGQRIFDRPLAQITRNCRDYRLQQIGAAVKIANDVEAARLQRPGGGLHPGGGAHAGRLTGTRPARPQALETIETIGRDQS